MQVDSKILDDLARVASGAVGALSGLRSEVEAQLRQQLERVLAQLEVVTRDEFEAVREMAAEARNRQEAMAGQVSALEATVAALREELDRLKQERGSESAG